ncbi:MAG TPA: cobalamin-independent methionine synthase II family protein [Dehalococcoidia bacterium]|nr:cobalamin-independent methionine synthase II family protein [Dehalococcoidia bacterium]
MTASPYRADHVGSLLRPPELLEARAKFSDGKLSEEQFRQIEDESVSKALELQRQAGVHVLTDGEYRRTGWSAAAAGAIDGLVPVEGSPIRRIFAEWRGPDAGEVNQMLSRVQAMVAGDKVHKMRRFVEADAAFLRENAPGPWKITLPGPMSMAGGMFEPGVSEAAYPDRFALAEDLAPMLNDEFKALVKDGAPYVQLDSLHYVERVADVTIRERMKTEGEDPDAYLEELIRLDNIALAGLRGTPGLTVGLHMCRGNARSRWHAEGSYEPVAEKAFQQLNVDRFLLEYESERAGGFEPLRFVPRDKSVVLGIISSKIGALESVDELRRRVEEAAKYVPIENLAVSPQCGFASTQQGNLVTWDEQRRKLELVVELAQKAFS